jgi:hypothetical protein
MSKERKFNQALSNLRYNYPQGVTTWGNCCTDGCSNPARGSGKCAVCCENEIADIIGSPLLANEIHEATKNVNQLIGHAMKIISE